MRNDNKLHETTEQDDEVLPILRTGGEVGMSEYRGGPLDELADLFMKALRTDDPHEKNRLIDE